MGHSFIKTVVDGAVLSMPSRLRPAATSTLEDHSGSLADKLLLGGPNYFPPDYQDMDWNSRRLFSMELVEAPPALSLLDLRCLNPPGPDTTPR